jgi:hypothetical protein
MIIFLEKITTKMKNNELNDNQINKIFNFYTEYEMTKKGNYSIEDYKKYIFLGWYVDNLIKN